MNHIIRAIILVVVFYGSFANTNDKQPQNPPDTTGNVLSSWELFVINDLVFQITMKKCPKINRPAASSLKDYITDAIKQAPQENKQQHPDFLPSYKTLMNCFDFLDTKSRTPGKKLEYVRFINNEQPNTFEPKSSIEVNSDSKNLKEDPLDKTETRTTNNPVEFVTSRLNYAWQDIQGDWHWQWMNKVSNMFSTVFRPKRHASTEADESKDQENTRTMLKKNADGIQVRKLSDAQNNFIKILHDLNKVVRLSCPVTMMPNGSFSRKAQFELNFWVSQDSHSLVRASGKYFGDNSLIQQVHECMQSI